MAVYDTLPSQNLKFDDIRDTLNSNGGAVTNVVSTAFQEGAKINKWAKYKPVPYPFPFAENSSEWWKGTDYMCGFSNIGNGSVLSLMQTYISGNIWTYSLPKGNSQEPYRLGDFRGYTTNILVPMRSLYKKGSKISLEYNDSTPSITYEFEVDQFISDNHISARDFTGPVNLSKAKFCVLAFRNDPSYGTEDTPSHVFIGDELGTKTLCKVKCALSPKEDNYIVFCLVYDNINLIKQYHCLPIDLSIGHYMTSIYWNYIPNEYGLFIKFGMLGFTETLLEDVVVTPVTSVEAFLDGKVFYIKKQGKMVFWLNVKNAYKDQEVKLPLNDLYYEWSFNTEKQKFFAKEWEGSTVDFDRVITIPANFDENNVLKGESLPGIISGFDNMNIGMNTLTLYLYEGGSYKELDSIRIYVSKKDS